MMISLFVAATGPQIGKPLLGYHHIDVVFGVVDVATPWARSY